MSEKIKDLLLFPGAKAEMIARMAPYLKNIPDDALDWAIGELVKTSKYLPSVKEITDKAAEYVPPKIDLAHKMLLDLELKYYQTGEVDEGEWDSLIRMVENAGRWDMATYFRIKLDRITTVVP